MRLLSFGLFTRPTCCNSYGRIMYLELLLRLKIFRAANQPTCEGTL